MESASDGSLEINDLIEISVAIEACELVVEELIQAVGFSSNAATQSKQTRKFAISP
ncbi:MAG: hypothetical protein CM1200mP39_10610 [Dehalococcoidia bacterium]|nr:MAG: hypothetical protein CM1200mP39_10610 [Dehalococcoidia bacterium]